MKTPCLAGCAGVVAEGRSRGEVDRRRLRGGDGDWGVGRGERRRLAGIRCSTVVAVSEGVVGSCDRGGVVAVGGWGVG